MNKCANVPSTKLAGVLNLSTTALTTCLFNAREHLAKSGEIRRRTTMRWKGNYPKFKKILKKNCDIKSQRKPTGVLQMQSQSRMFPKV